MRKRTRTTQNRVPLCRRFEPLEQRIVLDSTVVFNELMYHPPGNEETLEWIELYNQLAVDMDISHWRLAGAVDYQFSDGTILPGRGYLVIAVNPQELSNQTGFSDALGPFNGRLSNGGEELQLLNNNDRVMNLIDYRDGGDWPVGPDGIGFTLAKRKELLNTADPGNWITSDEIGGTPGSANFVVETGPTTLELIEPGAQARYLIPTIDNLNSQWTQTAFDDSTWPSGTTAIGYEPIISSAVAYGNLTGAEGSISLPGPLGHDFVVNSTISVTQLGVFDSAADGLNRTITAELWSRDGNSGTRLARLAFTTNEPGTLIESNRFKPLDTPVILLPGDYTISAYGYGSSEKAGHEGFGGPSSAFKTFDDGEGAISFTGSSRLGTSAGSFPSIVEAGTINYYSAGTFRFSTGVVGASDITTNIGPEMNGVNTTTWVRMPFNVNNTIGLSSMTLDMKYNDGFVAFINGQEIARRNAPASLTWNSAAPSGSSNLIQETIDVSTSIPFLQTGSNVLSVHGLNASASDSRFFILPELKIVESESTSTMELVFNEMDAGGSPGFFLEIGNETGTSQSVSGCAIISSAGTEYLIPNQTIVAGGQLSIAATELGFIPEDGDELFLLSPSRQQLLDAQRVTGRLRGQSEEQNSRWLYPNVSTPGMPNSFQFEDDIVINEIFYHPFGQQPANIDIDHLESLVSTTLVPEGAQASVLIPSDDSLGNSWQLPGFNDSSWFSGPTGIGFETTAVTGVVAYENLPGASGSSSLSGPYGHDFTVNSTITITHLGVFDSGANGLKRNLTTEIWSREGDTGSELAQLTFSTSNPGTLIGSSRFKTLATPLVLAPGEYTVAAHGFGSNEKAGHQGFGGPSAAFKTLDDGNGDISFVGESRIGTSPDHFPAYSSGGDVNHFSAGSFQFDTGGYLDQHVATDFETAMHGKNASAYLRMEFSTIAPTPDQFAKLMLRMKYDDGYIAYLNGTEVARRNAPSSPTFDSSATTAEESLSFQKLDISARIGLLQTGTNVLAIQGLNVDMSDGDFLITPELKLETASKPQSEWIELYNRGTATIDLSDWKIDGGISFIFPSGTLLAPDNFLVVSSNAAQLSASYPDINIVGNFSGRLNNRDDLIQLIDVNKNPADEVHYFQDGYWPQYADGGGSSLELRNPDADNSKPGAWEASEEASQSTWNSYTYRGVANPFESDGPQYHELVIGLLDDGEILIDDITVVEDPDSGARPLIQNSTFESDSIGSEADKWRIYGNHFGTVVVDPDDVNNQVLHLRSTGAFDDMHNHGETTFKDGSYVQIVPSEQYEISFRAKWLGGTNLFNTRLYYNNVSQTITLPIPQLNGTPGAENSRYEANIGPTFSNFNHGPVVPDENQAVTVTTVVDDPDGVSSGTLHWRTVSNRSEAWQIAEMAISNDGTLSGNIPGHSSSTVVQFYVEATDGLGFSSTFPRTGPESRALYKVQDNRAGSRPQHRLRIIQASEDVNFQLDQINRMSNHRFGGTVVFNESEVFYDTGIRLKGASSSRPSGSHGYNIRFQATQKFLGIHQTITVDRNNVPEFLIKHLNNRVNDVPSMYNDAVYLIDPVNPGKNGVFQLRLAGYGDVYLDEQFGDGATGMLIDKEIIYRPNGTNGGVEGRKLPGYHHTSQGNADIGIDHWGTHKEAYRLQWRAKNNRNRDDLSQIVQLNEAFRLGGTIPDDQWNDELNKVMDVDQWLRVMAMTRLAGVGDYYSQSPWNHNYLVYPRPDTKQLVMLPWDLDIAFSNSAALVGTYDHPVMRKIVQIPENRRRIYGHYDNLIDTGYNSTYVNAWSNHLNSIFQNSFTGAASYIGSRASSVKAQLPDEVPFQITTTGPLDVGSDSTTTIQGKGWVNVREIRLTDTTFPLDIDWSAGEGVNYAETWETSLSLTNGTSAYIFEAYDFEGGLIDTATIQITTTGGDTVVESLRVTEINYNPSDPTLSELANQPSLNSNDFEFIEVQNTGTQIINLQNVHFTNGVEFAFPSVNLAAGQHAIIVKDQAAFELRYGTGANVLGNFTSGGLNNDGENLRLVINAEEILDFSYGDSDPWPERTDGKGATLELIDPVTTPVEQYGKHYHWRASTELDGTPGSTGNGSVGVVINEILANTNPPVVTSDSIELLNTTSSPIDIGGWYLSDSSTRFLKFQIPVNTIVDAGAYIVFDEDDFNPHPINPGPNDFSLSGTGGDDVWLTIPNGSGGVLSFVDDVHFGASANGESFGRTLNGSGRLAPMSSITLGSNNAAPRVGPLVIAEVNYNPGTPSTAALAKEPTLTDADLEYLEILNPSGESVDLTNWRIRGGIDFDFEAGTIISKNQSVVLISFNPDSEANTTRLAAFHAHYGSDESVPLLGPFANRLGDSSDRIELQRASVLTPGNPTSISRLEEDQILYDDLAPWPTTADGTGDSLHRTYPPNWGSEATSWTANTPRPGQRRLPGDTDLDNDVDTADLTTAIINFTSAGGTGKTWSDGDIDGDGDVDTSDLTTAIINFTGALSKTTVAAASTPVVANDFAATGLTNTLQGDMDRQISINSLTTKTLEVVQSTSKPINRDYKPRLHKRQQQQDVILEMTMDWQNDL